MNRRAEGLELHPDAVRPPFDWDIALPSDWAVLETHPSRWERQVDRIVDDFFAGKKLPADVRRKLVATLGSYVATAQKEKILLSLVQVGVSPETKAVENISLQLMWTSSAPRPASMVPIRTAMAATKGSVEELTTPTGQAYGLVSISKKNPFDSSAVAVDTVQGFYPLPGTTWTLVVSLSAPASLSSSHGDATNHLRSLAIRCMNSVSFSRTAGNTAGSEDVLAEGMTSTLTKHQFTAG